MNEADVVFLCLPDDAARRAVLLVENPATRVIDASTAHRVDAGWTYGLPELSKAQRAAIRSSRRIANPGCHATGFVACVAPLVSAGIVRADRALPCFSITGYTGGGKQMIADYESEGRSRDLDAPGIYGLTLTHKHLPEMRAACGLTRDPLFLPVVADFPRGMATTVMLSDDLLPGHADATEIRACLADHYAGQPLVTVAPGAPEGPRIHANALAGTDSLRLYAYGSDGRTCVTALFDNLGKGASGAAVQNMNVALGIEETRGLRLA